MPNPDYQIDAIGILLNEDCILKGFYPLIPYKDAIIERLRALGCIRKSDAVKIADEELLQAGLPEIGMVKLFRRFLVLYDPKQQKMREIEQISKNREETKIYEELYKLPGVKNTRARLYALAGFDCLEDIAHTAPETLIAACERMIAKEKLAMKPPLMKEARTHIAVAKAFCDVLDT